MRPRKIFALLDGPEGAQTHSSACASVSVYKLTSGPYMTSKNDSISL